MFNMITNFFNTSLAALSIYDILVIILFILAIILSIISGIIIISARVKKINTELDKSKSIQDINEKIIQNRLDLIINKLNTSETQLSNQSLLPVSTITNNNIKQAINNTPEESNNIQPNEYIIKLPPPASSLKNNLEKEDTQEKVDISNNNNEEVTTENEKTNNVSFLEEATNNIIDTSASNTNVDIQSIDIATEKPQISHEPELITVDTNNIPETDRVINKEKDTDFIIDIKDENEKNNEITINYFSQQDAQESVDSVKGNFEEAPSIPLTPISETPLEDNTNLENTTENENYNDSDNEYQDIDLQYEEETQEKDHQPAQRKDNNLKIINEALNQLCIFTNREKFNITTNISKDGLSIRCLINKESLPLNYKELNRQLLLQQFIDKYNYPVENIEIDFPVELDDTIKQADIVVFNDENDPIIVAIVAIPHKKKRFKFLKTLLNHLQAPYAVWTDGENIMYYKNNNGTLEEVSYLPEYNEDIDEEIEHPISENTAAEPRDLTLRNTLKHNNVESSYNFNNKNYNKSYTQKENQESYSSEQLPKKVSNFSKDSYNIYRNQPYSLSKEYQRIIEKYRNLRNNFSINRNPLINNKNPLPTTTPVVNNNIPLHINNYPINNFKQPHGNTTMPQPIPYNNRIGNFLINKFREKYMNRNYNCNNNFPQSNPNFNVNNGINPRSNYNNNFISRNPIPTNHINNNVVRPQVFNRPPVTPLNFNNMPYENNCVQPPFLPPIPLNPFMGNNPINPNANQIPTQPVAQHMPPQPINMSFPMMPQRNNIPRNPNQLTSNLPLNYNNILPNQINHNVANTNNSNQPINNTTSLFNNSNNTRFKSYKEILDNNMANNPPKEPIRLFNHNLINKY